MPLDAIGEAVHALVNGDILDYRYDSARDRSSAVDFACRREVQPAARCIPKRWLRTQGDKAARKRADAFWDQMRHEFKAGAFWADRIKGLRDKPNERLELALAHLPLPAAFREAAIAIRALIRAKRRDGEAYEQDLSLLYRVAALRSFMIDYAPNLLEPGFNVVQAIPGNRLEQLTYSYNELGYRHLSLLNKTDIEWLTQAWGEPQQHTTLHVLHKDLWDEYETKLARRRWGGSSS